MAGLVWLGGQQIHLQNFCPINVTQREYPENINWWEVATIIEDGLEHLGQDNKGVGNDEVLILKN